MSDWYETILEHDTCEGEPCFFASHSELRGCHGWGWTWEEAVTSLKEAKEDYLRVLRERNIPIPQPRFVPSPVPVTYRVYANGVLLKEGEATLTYSV